MKATQKFSQFTFWNLETPPSNNDAIVKAMQWINIASAVSNRNYVIYTNGNYIWKCVQTINK